MEKYLGLPLDASMHGGEVDQIIGLMHWLMLILFVGWGAFFIYTLFRFRAGRNPRADYAGVKSRMSTYLEVSVAVVEAILLIGFSIPAWAKRVHDLPPEGESTVVRVVAQQFAWNIHYPGADGVFGRTEPQLVDTTNPVGLDRSDLQAQDDIVTINQLHLPVDKPVIIHLSTLDVIHSFSLPYMRVKQDAIPGVTIPIWFVPTQVTPEGRPWEIACAQLCGNSHYRMRGFLRVHTQEGFEAWLAERAAKK
jgi:cytochrome c oxidase subunit 2